MELIVLGMGCWWRRRRSCSLGYHTTGSDARVRPGRGRGALHPRSHQFQLAAGRLALAARLFLSRPARSWSPLKGRRQSLSRRGKSSHPSFLTFCCFFPLIFIPALFFYWIRVFFDRITLFQVNWVPEIDY